MRVPPIFKPFRNETVYSVVSRYHAVSGFLDHNVAIGNVFEKSKKRIHPYVPNGLRKFSDYFSIETSTVVRHQTLFPLFAGYFSEAQSAKLKVAMLENTGSAFLGSLTPHFKLHLFAGHKFCPKCADKDFDEYGTTYWRIEHQVPGISACSIHCCRLVGLCNDDAHLDRRLVTPPIKAETVTASTKEVELACYTQKVLTSFTEDNSSNDMLKVLLGNLTEVGFVTPAGSLRFSNLKERLYDYWRELDTGIELGLPANILSFDFIGSMLRQKTRTPAHPLKHLLLSCWLENDASLMKKVVTRAPIVSTNTKKIDNRIISLHSLGSSMNCIEQQLDVSRCYIRKVLEINGITHASNSMKMSERLIRQVIVKGIYGYSVNEIANQLSIKPSTVEHLLCRTAGLCKWRKHLRHQKRVLMAIHTLTRARKLHPNWLRKHIKQKHSAEFFLLYQHDKCLLESLLPPKNTPKPPNAITTTSL